MQLPRAIIYRNVPKTEDVDNLIREKAAKLEQFCSYMTSCRIAVEKRHEHQETGQPFRVRIEMNVPPGHRLIAQRESTAGEIHTQLPTIVRQAFDAARRQLEKITAQQQGETKRHPRQETMALFEKIFPEDVRTYLPK